MALITQFNTPAGIEDLKNDPNLQKKLNKAWHDRVSSVYNGSLPSGEMKGKKKGVFYNPTKIHTAVLAKKTFTWMAMPREQLIQNRDDRNAAYKKADQLRVKASKGYAYRFFQNEYIEWFVNRDPNTNLITKVSFVTEFRSYYHTLYSVAPQRLLQIYRDLVDPNIPLSDLEITNPNTNKKSYNEENIWNTQKGIVHYLQGINSLPAAMFLVRGSIKNKTFGNNNYECPLDAKQATTSADPRIGYDLTMLARKDLYVTLEDPIGIYILHWDNSGITDKNGNPAPPDFWKIKRHNGGRIMRLEYEVPSQYNYVVGEMKIGGRPVEYGAQLAEQITVGITGTAGMKVPRLVLTPFNS